MGQIFWKLQFIKLKKLFRTIKNYCFLLSQKLQADPCLIRWFGIALSGFGGKVFKEDSVTVEAKSRVFCLFTKFAFIRHPLDRIISCYKDKIFKPSEDDERWIIEPRRKWASLKVWPLKASANLLSEHGSDEFADRHWVTQDKSISLYGAEWFPEYVFDVDNQEKWKEFVFQFSDTKKPIVNFNRSGSDELFVPTP